MQLQHTYFSNPAAHLFYNLHSIDTFDGTHWSDKAVKPNTKAFKQNNLKCAQLLSSEGAQRERKQNKK